LRVSAVKFTIVCAHICWFGVIWGGRVVLRTPVPAAELDAPAAVAAYKDLAHVEQDFRISKDDLDLRPIWHRLDDRVRARVLICMLACYLAWHLRKAWAPLTYIDEQPRSGTTRSPPLTARVRPRPKPPARSPTAASRPTASATCSATSPRSPANITIGGHQIEKITAPTPPSSTPATCSARLSPSPWSRHQPNHPKR
jgi:hypothetical protein